MQDGPPPGGFPAVNVKRNLPGGGLSSIALMGGCVLTFTYGMYTIICANRQRRCESSHRSLNRVPGHMRTVLLTEH